MENLLTQKRLPKLQTTNKMLLAESEQIHINNETIDSFRIEQGQTIKISVPDNKTESILIDGLIKKSPVKALKLYDTFIFADYISNKTSIIDKLLNRNLVLNFVKYQLNCDAQKGLEILKKARIDEDWVKNKLAGTPKRILEVLLAFEVQPNIVYTIHGMDPVGVEYLQQLIAKEVEIRKGSAIEIIQERKQKHNTK